MRRALAFLTPLPVGRAGAPDRRSLAWVPVVGALIGLALGGIWWGAEHIWPPAVAAALVVLADLALTGMLHMDGLVDSADGLLPHAPTEGHEEEGGRQWRLDVMQQADIGAFGVVIAI